MGDQTAILTNGQRGYLRGEKEPSQERTTKTRLRRRAQMAFCTDIPLLEQSVDAEDLLEGADLKAMRHGLESTIRLVYRLADEAGHDPDDLIEESTRDLRQGRADEVWEALARGDIRADFDDLDTLRDGGRIPENVYDAAYRKRLGKGEDLTHGEIIEAWRKSRESKMPTQPHDIVLENLDIELDELLERVEQRDPDLMESHILALVREGELDMKDAFEYYEDLRGEEESLPSWAQIDDAINREDVEKPKAETSDGAEEN
jgi:hypothetical protein